MTRPAECLVERAEFLEEKLILLQRRDRFRAARADVNAIAHDFPPLKHKGSPRPFGPGSPLRTDVVVEWADGVAFVLVIDRKFPCALALGANTPWKQNAPDTLRRHIARRRHDASKRPSTCRSHLCRSLR